MSALYFPINHDYSPFLKGLKTFLFDEDGVLTVVLKPIEGR